MKTLFISLLATSFLLGSISNANTCPAWVQNETTNCSTLSPADCVNYYTCDGGCSDDQKKGKAPVNQCVYNAFTTGKCSEWSDDQCTLYITAD